MERGAQRIVRLFDEGKSQEAIALMETKAWGLEEDGSACPTTTAD